MAEIVLNGKKYELKANAMTMLIYEDEFKGSSFLNDFEKLENPLINKSSNISGQILIQMIWACIKTADDSTPKFNEWKKQLQNISMGEIYEANIDVVIAISQNMASPSKKLQAAAENNQNTISRPQN